MNRFFRPVLACGLACALVGLLAVLLLTALFAPPVRASVSLAGPQPVAPYAIIRVPDDYATIQAAIDAAHDGDAIQVAQGNYKENLAITKGITLSGGWDSSFTTRSAGASSINAQGQGRAISITCVSSDTRVTIDGFTIENGNATGQGGPPMALPEPARFFDGVAPPAVDDLAADATPPAERVAALRADLDALAAAGLYPGGEAAYRAARERIERLSTAADAPAAATVGSLQQEADYGGGVYSWNASLHLLNNILKSNLASKDDSGYGGGVFVGAAAPGGVRIAHNTLRGNIASAAAGATGVGGGLYVFGVEGVSVTDNTFRDNVGNSAGLGSVGVGGGLALDECPAATLRDNLVTRNTANAGWFANAGIGGGAYLRRIHQSNVAHNTFTENLGVVQGGGGSGGLLVAKSTDVSVADNTVSGNWGCIFQPDLTNLSAGGIAVHNVTRAVVTNNAITDNTACISGAQAGDCFGGGIDGQLLFDTRITSNTIANNVAIQRGIGWGGGISVWAAEGSSATTNTITGNVASLSGLGGGGGMFLRNTDGFQVLFNRIQGNRAARQGRGSGGGMRVEQQGPYTFDTLVDGNLFLDNHAGSLPTDPSDGGACAIDTDGLTFSNNVVAGNTADQGGGLHLSRAVAGVVVNNTFVDNGDAGAWVDEYNTTPITFTNNIIVQHTVGITVSAGATVTARYTLWRDNGANLAGEGATSQIHPVSGAPAFRDPGTHDYRLTVASAARDAGDPAGAPPAPDHDADGAQRPFGAGVDIGAYEWRGAIRYLPMIGRNACDLPACVGWAVGDAADGYGTILHTTDGGATWRRQPALAPSGGPGGSPADVPNANLTAISAADAANAWAVGVAGVILRTRDGGQTWERQVVPAGLEEVEFHGVKALDGRTAFAVGAPDALIHTTDGETWQVTPRAADLHLAWPVNYADVDAVDATHAWAVGGTGAGGRGVAVIAFFDGVQWRRQAADLVPDEGSHVWIGVSALDRSTVWAVGGWQLAMAKTTDGGTTWQTVGPELSPGDMNRVVAVTADIGWAAGDYGMAQRTLDGGQTWSHDPTGTGSYLYTVSAVSAEVAWVVGPNENHSGPGWLLRTLNGHDWEARRAPVNADLSGLSFVGARR